MAEPLHDNPAPPMVLPRPCIIRCPCGWEREVVLDLANDPAVWFFQCPAPECNRIYTVKMAFDVEFRTKPHPVKVWGVRGVE